MTTSFDQYKARTDDVLGVFEKLAQTIDSVTVARVYEALCSDASGRCVNADQSGVYYFDDDHLSTAGAALVIPMIVKQVLRGHTPKPG